MKKTSSLLRLGRTFVHRIHHLEGVASQCVSKYGHDIDRSVAFVAIEAASAWSSFAREYYLSCALLRPLTPAGPISHSVAGIVDERTALLHSIAVLKGGISSTSYIRAAKQARIQPREEPVWHEKRALITLASTMNFSNYNTILTALSYPTTSFDDLPPVRNFYAHRWHGSADRVARIAPKYGLLTITHPNELINRLFSTRSQTLLQEWLGDFRQIATALCS